ncbi:MAG: hypothetical protein ACTSWY_10045 [Promethearchaeota archaeon]
MPKAYVVTRWTEEFGLIVESSFPEDFKIDLDDMMRVFYAHITGTSVSKAGSVVIKLAKSRCNVSSYFTGMKSDVPIMINLMLELGEDPDMFGDAVIQEINEDILKFFRRVGTNLSKNYPVAKELKYYLKNSLFLLERLKNMTKGQRMASIYSSEKGRAILETLQERTRSRWELQNILEQKFGQITSNLEITLDPFIKSGLIKQDWIGEGNFSDVFLFLRRDFTISRKPANKLIEQARRNKPSPSLAKSYLKEVNSFFSKYEPTRIDNYTVAQNMLNPDKFDFISLFREKSYPVSKIPKSSADAFRDVSTILRAMEKDNILKVINDEKTKKAWIFLLTDVSVTQFYPEYLIEKIRKDQKEGVLNKKIAVKHLQILEDEYTNEVESL